MLGLKKAFEAATTNQSGVKYPYIFIDQSQQGQLSPYRLYTDIFSKHRVVWSVDRMKGYIIGAPDFEAVFKIIEDNKTFTAKYENKTTKTKRKHRDSSKSSETESSGEESYSSSSSQEQHQLNKRNRRFVY